MFFCVFSFKSDVNSVLKTIYRIPLLSLFIHSESLMNVPRTKTRFRVGGNYFQFRFLFNWGRLRPGPDIPDEPHELGQRDTVESRDTVSVPS